MSYNYTSEMATAKPKAKEKNPIKKYQLPF